MKLALFGLLSLVAVHAHGATAYDALGTVGKQRGEKLLDQVTEVRGINGAPQPKEWLIIVADKEARGGVREFGVQGTKIGAERAPVGREPGQLMNMNQLNLDSDGAHTVAEREAKKAGFEYDYVDYTLRAGTRGGAPIWEVRLVDQQSGNFTLMTIAADKGTLLSVEGADKSSRRDTPPPPPDADQPGKRKDERPPANDRGSENTLERAGAKVGNFFERVGRHMDRRGRQIGDRFHNFFTGDNRDTAGPRPPRNPEPAPPKPPKTEPAPPKPSPARDANGTEYYRPRD